MTDVSVVVPTRDRADLVVLTARSVLRQRGTDLELVVVDDGSADGTASRLAALGDPRVRVLRHERSRGVSTARNAGIDAARGRWVAFLDDDDLWSPDKLRAQLDAAGDRGWVVSGAVTVDDGLEVLSVDRPTAPDQLVRDLDRWNSVPAGASNVLARRDALDAAGRFDPGLRHMSDWDLWIRLGRQGPPAVVDRPDVAYRLHLASATLGTGVDAQEPLAELDVIARRYGTRPDRAAVHRWIGWSALRGGRRAAAVRAYAAAVAAGDPRSLLRAGLAAVHPGAGRRTFFAPRRRQEQDDAWTLEARAWLHDLARSSRAPS